LGTSTIGPIFLIPEAMSGDIWARDMPGTAVIDRIMATKRSKFTAVPPGSPSFAGSDTVNRTATPTSPPPRLHRPERLVDIAQGAEARNHRVQIQPPLLVKLQIIRDIDAELV
jgi:hypothetical protein